MEDDEDNFSIISGTTNGSSPLLVSSISGNLFKKFLSHNRNNWNTGITSGIEGNNRTLSPVISIQSTEHFKCQPNELAVSPTQETSVTKLDHREHPVQSQAMADSNDLFVSTTNAGLEMNGSEKKSMTTVRTGVPNNTTVNTLQDLDKGGSEDSKMFDTKDNLNHETSLTSDEDNQSVASISTIPPTPPDLKSHLTSLVHSQKKKRTPSINASCVDVTASKQADQEHLSSEGSVKSYNILQTTHLKISPCTTSEDKKNNVEFPSTAQTESNLTENTLQGRQCIEQELTKQVNSLNSKFLLDKKQFEEVDTSIYPHNKTEKLEIKTTSNKQPDAMLDVNEKMTFKKTSTDLTSNTLSNYSADRDVMTQASQTPLFCESQESEKSAHSLTLQVHNKEMESIKRLLALCDRLIAKLDISKPVNVSAQLSKFETITQKLNTSLEEEMKKVFALKKSKRKSGQFEIISKLKCRQEMLEEKRSLLQMVFHKQEIIKKKIFASQAKSSSNNEDSRSGIEQGNEPNQANICSQTKQKNLATGLSPICDSQPTLSQEIECHTVTGMTLTLEQDRKLGHNVAEVVSDKEHNSNSKANPALPELDNNKIMKKSVIGNSQDVGRNSLSCESSCDLQPYKDEMGGNSLPVSSHKEQHIQLPPGKEGRNDTSHVSKDVTSLTLSADIELVTDDKDKYKAQCSEVNLDLHTGPGALISNSKEKECRPGTKYILQAQPVDNAVGQQSTTISNLNRKNVPKNLNNSKQDSSNEHKLIDLECDVSHDVNSALRAEVNEQAEVQMNGENLNIDTCEGIDSKGSDSLEQGVVCDHTDKICNQPHGNDTQIFTLQSLEDENEKETKAKRLPSQTPSAPKRSTTSADDIPVSSSTLISLPRSSQAVPCALEIPSLSDSTKPGVTTKSPPLSDSPKHEITTKNPQLSDSTKPGVTTKNPPLPDLPKPGVTTKSPTSPDSPQPSITTKQQTSPCSTASSSLFPVSSMEIVRRLENRFTLQGLSAVAARGHHQPQPYTTRYTALAEPNKGNTTQPEPNKGRTTPPDANKGHKSLTESNKGQTTCSLPKSETSTSCRTLPPKPPPETQTFSNPANTDLGENISHHQGNVNEPNSNTTCLKTPNKKKTVSAEQIKKAESAGKTRGRPRKRKSPIEEGESPLEKIGKKGDIASYFSKLTSQEESSKLAQATGNNMDALLLKPGSKPTETIFPQVEDLLQSRKFIEGIETTSSTMGPLHGSMGPTTSWVGPTTSMMEQDSVEVLTLLKSLKTVELIADQEVTGTSEDFPTDFWTENFSDIKMSKAFWDSVDSW